MPGLNVVCLISGGKDSAFSILHCLANGHDVVALANLYPAPDAHNAAPDDLDSYMYQTIGHGVIPLYERALGLPLYRQEILGHAINQNKSYGPSATAHDDETESLLHLLAKVKTSHPEVNAVSTGAILSDYQRTRVESVAVRLGLTSLSYLWQYPFLPPFSQTSLLEDMAAVGQDSRIIKVASGALDESFLWQNVADHKTISRLDKASNRFGSLDDGAVLGEGGEYETLAVAGPAPVWKGRIVVRPEDRAIIVGDAGSSFLRILGADVKVNVTQDQIVQDVRTPPLLEPRFEAILTRLQGIGSGGEHSSEHLNGNVRGADDAQAASKDTNSLPAGTQNQALLSGITGDGVNVEEQMRSTMAQADALLRERGMFFADVAYTSIMLRDMSDFLAINAVYGTYFSHPSPPARFAIACAAVLPPDKHVLISFTTTKLADRSLRKGLHVQSRSYWAPANIGPYSQAVAVPMGSIATSNAAELVYISGQIPLVPASMELASSSSGGKKDAFELQCVLALQHAVRVGRAMQVRSYLSTIVFITAISIEEAESRSNVAYEVWKSFHCANDTMGSGTTADDSDDPDFDVWDLKYGLATHHTSKSYSPQMNETAKAHSQSTAPPLYVIRVDALPRNASVEWVTYGLTKETSTSPSIPHFDHLLGVFKENIVRSYA